MKLKIKYKIVPNIKLIKSAENPDSTEICCRNWYIIKRISGQYSVTQNGETKTYNFISKESLEKLNIKHINNLNVIKYNVI